MIKRMNPGSLQVNWSGINRNSPLFASRPELRRMVVLIDNELLASAETQNVTPNLILTGLLSHSLISMYRYSDEGPPASVKPRKFGDWTTAHEGWATVGPRDDETGARTVTYVDGDTVTDTSILPKDLIEFAHGANPSIYGELSEEVRSSRRQADVIASQVASSIGADLFITERKLLHEGHPAFTRYITAMGMQSALPLVSLYLRSQGRYITYRSPDSTVEIASNKRLFTWAGARELLPSSWRWFSACVQASDSTKDDTLLYLGQSTIQRVQRALSVRDTVHTLVNRPQDHDVADDLLSNLDTIFVLLMGALDAAARVAHIALALPANKMRRAGWQTADWLILVQGEDRRLADLMATGTPEQYLLTVLRLLRNSVHAEALQSLTVQNGTNAIDTLFSLPSADMTELVKAIEKLGGIKAWGVKQQIPGRMHADPHTLLEAIFPRVLDLLDKIMLCTPVERLPNCQASMLPSGPPDEPKGIFSQNSRHSIRWQLGF